MPAPADTRPAAKAQSATTASAAKVRAAKALAAQASRSMQKCLARRPTPQSQSQRPRLPPASAQWPKRDSERRAVFLAHHAPCSARRWSHVCRQKHSRSRWRHSGSRSIPGAGGALPPDHARGLRSSQKCLRGPIRAALQAAVLPPPHRTPCRRAKSAGKCQETAPAWHRRRTPHWSGQCDRKRKPAARA